MDLLFRKSHEYITPIEIKGAMTWNKEFAAGIGKIRKLSPKFKDGFVIYGGELNPEIEGVKFLNFRDTAQAVST